MTGAEVKKLSSEEVTTEIKRLREQLFKLRNQATTEKVEDTSQFRKIRKDVARLQTERSARFAARDVKNGKTPGGKAPAKAAAKK